MRDPADWMLSEAIEALARAERLHRQMFQPPSATRRPAWEPPVDVLETEQEDGTLVVVGHPVLPPQLRTAVIHRLELPQGRFERRIPLPPGHYDAVRRAAGDGCLVISLRKAP